MYFLDQVFPVSPDLPVFSPNIQMLMFLSSFGELTEYWQIS